MYDAENVAFKFSQLRRHLKVSTDHGLTTIAVICMFTLQQNTSIDGISVN